MMIIKAGEELLPEILEIEATSFGIPWSEGSFLSEIYSEDAHFEAALDGDTVTGYCVTHFSPDEGELYKIAVRSDLRRGGIASALMASAVAEAERRGAARLFLEVRAGNAPAIALYKKYGFVSAGVRRGYYDRPKEDALVMIKEVLA
ncbi:MAG: ribosomal protein S18-alanine N-acetyltransferase [Oscillospiraceae bacterium]|nr:ribosomal protein S18-alanine N-acetyltransferase [Oscillospiraceae bacterium]